MRASLPRQSLSPRSAWARKRERRNPKSLLENDISMHSLSASVESLNLLRNIKMRY